MTCERRRDDKGNNDRWDGETLLHPFEEELIPDNFGGFGFEFDRYRKWIFCFIFSMDSVPTSFFVHPLFGNLVSGGRATHFCSPS